MFSRAAKSIAKTISQRKYHVGDENIKLAMVGGSGGISRSFSQMLKRTSKLDVLTLYDVAALNKRFLSIPKRLHSFDVGEPINPEKSRLFSALENLESSKEYRSGAVQEPTNIAQKETQELIDSLRRLPIAEECAADRLMENNLRPQLQATPGSLSRNQQLSDKVLEANREDRTESLGRLLRFSTTTFRNWLRARNQRCSGSFIGNWSRNAWSWTSSSRFRGPELVCGRDFSTGFDASTETAKVVWISKELDRYSKQGQIRLLRTSSSTMGTSQKKPVAGRSSKSSQKCSSGSGEQRRGPCRQPYQRRKPCLPTEKCIPPAPPCCRRRPANPKCPDLPRPPCPPPCPMPCPKPVAPEKPPPPKICYRKCPPPPKLPRLPKFPKLPAPPPPPPLPKLPKPPRCPPPCPPPPAPPLPKCPRAPKCPECPAQKECPPPPPCEPCPCPLPCPPPCCPPPPPCPPCPPPIPCPKPLPCPPPPPPRLCPPCPPCPPCPKPPPCPPPPPCCPCPCPEPPPPCPCPKPCPPCKQTQPREQPKCPEGVPSCPKCPQRKIRKRKMSTYCAISMFLPMRSLQYRRLHVCAMRLKKSDKSSCKEIEDICKDTRKGGSCAKSCERKDDCGKKKPKCSDKVKKMQSKGRRKKKKKKKKKKDDCIQTCIPTAKCNGPRIAKPPKMEYGPAKCPPPKFVSPQPCPDPPEAETGPCVEVRSYIKPKKEVCPPLPLPKPPTNPVILCPCPPPPKMHPGPCPCFEDKQEQDQGKQFVPPCSVREKYVCPREPHFCPQEKLICKKEKVCDPKKVEKRNKKKEPPS
ncbi:uncharacterized protein LOC100880064 isoform X1 [Megachile rotundata]|uniref:uncharacterized protein LOC100880064 isoform X1 n=1 Tax=Megachile rotundata TaxID=143995 RepID=UPI003FCF71DB